MSNSMMTFNKKTLWIHDAYLEPIIYFVWKEIDHKIHEKKIPTSHLEWFTNYNQELANLFIGANGGALDLEFDALKTDPYRFDLVKDILISISDFLHSENRFLRKDDFGNIGEYSFGVYSIWDDKMSSRKIAEEILEIIEWIKS